MSMVICKDRHEPIVYEDWNMYSKRKAPCPVCEVLDREAVLEEDISILRGQVKELEQKDYFQGA